MAGTVAPEVIQHRPRGVVRTDITITTDASGVASEAVVGVGFGRLARVLYNGGLDASAVITIKDQKTGSTLVAYTTPDTAAHAFRPTTVITDNAGVAVTAAATAPNVNRDIYIGGKVSVVVSAGGNAKTGIVSLIVDEADLGPRPLI